MNVIYDARNTGGPPDIIMQTFRIDNKKLDVTPVYVLQAGKYLGTLRSRPGQVKSSLSIKEQSQHTD